MEVKRRWPTPMAQDAKNNTLPPSQREWDNIPGALLRAGENLRLNPAWVEQLMGVPLGWTLPEGRSMLPLETDLMNPLWPASPGNRQHPGEAHRTHQKAKDDRPRLKALGNTIVPQCVFVVGLQLAEAFLDSIRLEGVLGTERADVRALSVEGCAPQSTRRQEGHCGSSSESNGALDPPTQRSLQ